MEKNAGYVQQPSGERGVESKYTSGSFTSFRDHIYFNPYVCRSGKNPSDGVVTEFCKIATIDGKKKFRFWPNFFFFKS